MLEPVNNNAPLAIFRESEAPEPEIVRSEPVVVVAESKSSAFTVCAVPVSERSVTPE